MFVCLCMGVTSHVVNDIVAAGASTSKEIADTCGAGSDCGRCRHTLRAIIEAHSVNGCAPQRLPVAPHGELAQAAVGESGERIGVGRLAE